jgi:hypothetical protein
MWTKPTNRGATSRDGQDRQAARGIGSRRARQARRHGDEWGAPGSKARSNSSGSANQCDSECLISGCQQIEQTRYLVGFAVAGPVGAVVGGVLGSIFAANETDEAGYALIDFIHELVIGDQLSSVDPAIVPYGEGLAGTGESFEEWDEKEDTSAQRLRRSFTSHELVMSVPDAVGFVDDLLSYAANVRRTNDAILFNANLRITRNTRANIGMQRWHQSAHVEIFTHPDFTGSPGLYREIERLLDVYSSARLHWGQKFERNEIRTRYSGGRDWWISMRRLAKPQNTMRETFFSDFMLHRFG